MSDYEIRLRRGLRESAMGLVPPHHVDECVDLAIHAFGRAFEAVSQAARSASNTGVATCASSIALSLIAGEATAKLDGLKEFAAKHGGSVTLTSVNVGGPNG